MEILYMAYNNQMLVSNRVPVNVNSQVEVMMDVDDINNNCYLMNLPIEIVERILSYMVPTELLSLQATCKAFREYLLPKIWNNLRLKVGGLDKKSQSKLPAARYTSKKFEVGIKETDLLDFEKFVRLGLCDLSLSYVTVLNVDIQFGNDAAVLELFRLICSKMTNLERLEIRTIVRNNGISALPWLINSLKIPTALEITIDEGCSQLVDVSSVYLQSLRVISCRAEFNSEEIQHYCFNLGVNAKHLELRRQYFKMISSTNASYVESLSRKTNLESLIIDFIKVDHLVNWVPSSVKELALNGGGGHVNSLPNLEKLVVTATESSGFFNSEFPNLQTLVITACDEHIAPRLYEFLNRHYINDLHLVNFQLNQVPYLFTSSITTLHIDSPSFVSDPIMQLRQLANSLNFVSHLTIDLERLKTVQIVEAIKLLGAQLDSLNIKVLLKRPHKQYINEIGNEGCCRVDLVKFFSG